MERGEEASEHADGRLESVMPVINVEVELISDPLASAGVLFFQPEDLQRVQGIDDEAGKDCMSAHTCRHADELAPHYPIPRDSRLDPCWLMGW